MADIRITELPTAPAAITGAELVPVVQNGLTVQTTVAAITSSPNLNYTFLTVGQQPNLPVSRYFSTGVGLGVSDGGALGAYTLSLNGTSGSLETASTGVIVKTAANTIAARTLSTSGNGISVTDGGGISGNPTFQLTGLAAAIANASGTGILGLNGSTLTPLTITGVTNQIAVTNGNGAGGNPTIGIASNPVLPGNAYVQLPIGGTAQRGLPTFGALRYNSDLGLFEGYFATGWAPIVYGGSSFVSSFSGGTTGLLPATATSGAITLTGTLAVANGGTGVTTATGIGSVVLNNSPTLISPALGTPTSVVLTNATGLPLTTGITGVLQVNNGGTGVTISTGSGSNVLNTSPTLVTPILGTPASGVLTNTTGYLSANLVGAVSLTTQISGILPIVNGGTNSAATPTNGGVGYGTGTAHAYSAAGTNGQFLQSTGAGSPAWATVSTTPTSIGIASNSTNASYFPLFYTAATAASATTIFTAATYSFNPSTGTLSALAFLENSSPVASQTDIGTDPNQIPLNQYLGTLAFQDSAGLIVTGGAVSNIVLTQPLNVTPTITAIVAAGSTTTTVAQLLTQIITVTQTAAVTLVLPTGSLTDAGVQTGLSPVGASFEWSIINLGSASGAVTMSAGAAHTIVGSLTIPISTSARFRSVKTATNTYVSYRIT